MRISANILTLMEEHSLIQTIFDSENTGLELYYNARASLPCQKYPGVACGGTEMMRITTRESNTQAASLGDKYLYFPSSLIYYLIQSLSLSKHLQ